MWRDVRAGVGWLVCVRGRGVVEGFCVIYISSPSFSMVCDDFGQLLREWRHHVEEAMLTLGSCAGVRVSSALRVSRPVCSDSECVG